VSTDGAWDDWILFFLRGVTAQSRDSTERTQKLVSLRQTYYDRLRGPRVSQGLHRLIDDIFVVPALSVPMAVKRLGVTYASAKASIEKLVEAKILDADTVTYKGTTYWIATELTDAVESPLHQETQSAS